MRSCRRHAGIAFAIPFCLGLAPGVAHSGDHYVDAARGLLGDGASWATAWSRFADIDWSAVRPGDTVWVSGGSAGTVYAETLVVNASGRPGAPVTITAGRGRGHEARPVIDGMATHPYGIVMNGRDHVVVSGFLVRDHAEAGVSVREAHAGVVVERMDIQAGGPGHGNARGVDARSNTGAPALVVRGVTYTTPAYTAAQTDGIWSSDNDGVVFERNRIVISNGSVEGHSDGIQSYRDHRVVIRGNWIEQANTARTDNHGLWLSDTWTGGTIYVCGNTVLAPNLTGDSVVTHWTEATWPGRGTAVIRGNLIVGGSRSVNIDGTRDAEVTGNVLWPAAGGVAVHVANLPAPGPLIGRNVVRQPGAHPAGASLRQHALAGQRGRGLAGCGVERSLFEK